MAAYLCLALILYAGSVAASADSYAVAFDNGILNAAEGQVSIEQVKEPYQFSGLATYFNNVLYYVVSESDIRQLKEPETIELQQGEWLAIAGRSKVLLVKQTGTPLSYSEAGIRVLNPEIIKGADSASLIADKTQLNDLDPALNQLRYVHLWSGLAALAKMAEFMLVFIHDNVVSHWALTIILFAVIVKILLLPVTNLTKKSQDKVNLLRTELDPKLAQIKQDFDGEEAHNKIMAAHKDLGITPFFSLKPMLITLIQFPVLIAVFNALGEMPVFNGQSFLWIEDLAYPDAVGILPVQIPLLGDKISVLPVLMSVVTLLSVFVMRNEAVPASVVRGQRINLALMSLGFLILFYPFPASMVLYWTIANLLQLVILSIQYARSS